MERVAGIQTGGSERAFDLYMKARYLERQHPGHGVTFATGTPVSNTMVEMYTLCSGAHNVYNVVEFIMWCLASPPAFAAGEIKLERHITARPDTSPHSGPSPSTASAYNDDAVARPAKRADFRSCHLPGQPTTSSTIDW
jgi:hypothetical protein